MEVDADIDSSEVFESLKQSRGDREPYAPLNQ